VASGAFNEAEHYAIACLSMSMLRALVDYGIRDQFAEQGLNWTATSGSG